MKIVLKIKYLSFFAALLLPLAAAAADAQPEGHRFSPEERRARMAQRMAECQADPQKCREQFLARREQYCKDHAERCREIQKRMEQRRAECQADPAKCGAERQARFAQRFKLVDSDGDGLISRAEAQKTMPRLMHHFDVIDTNRDGQISMEELTAARKVRHERRQRRQESSKI